MWSIGPKEETGSGSNPRSEIERSFESVRRAIDRWGKDEIKLLHPSAVAHIAQPSSSFYLRYHSLSFSLVLDSVQERYVYVYMFCVVSSGLRWRKHWTAIQFVQWLNFFNYFSRIKGIIFLISSEKEGFDFVFLR